MENTILIILVVIVAFIVLKKVTGKILKILLIAGLALFAFSYLSGLGLLQ